LTAASHPVCNQIAFVFRHSAANLQQQLVVGIIFFHGAIHELNLAAVAA